ncbi:(2Fe-2S)-binding protein [Stagnimonas aquatica]|uniref:(2Fe-2S)-binding protein n=1 Tax=Stagnimonas aquatica TaxID=2689987 RepID=A0A3N0V2C6_9GAMM|nr:Rieske 2Fe-2S domain-containing protein [Stagnimonas aquatica]ROH86752.1 (2Fe-2S)-binding protein [Stagnimonas aquatica]
MATTKDYGLGEFTFPRGWFMIGESAKITSTPQGVRFFGQDFALYRGKQSGKVYLLDAYCPHMGTHLAKNSTSYVAQDGAVEGDSIRCPYHAWRFGPDGKCNHIPYSKGPIPPQARVKSWRVEERMGAVFVWHDPEGLEPDYEVPTIPVQGQPNWVPLAFDDLGIVGCHTQEIVDNITDVAHFGPVHGSLTKYFENEFQGHVATQRMGGGHRTLTTADGPLLETEAVYTGPSVLITKMFGTHNSYIYIAHTPVDDGSAYVWHGLMVESPTGQANYSEQDVEIARQYQAMALAAFAQDFEVWKHKKPCLKGLFVQGDGAFLKQRAWYKQFYNPRAQREELLKNVEGVWLANGMPGMPEQQAA